MEDKKSLGKVSADVLDRIKNHQQKISTAKKQNIEDELVDSNTETESNSSCPCGESTENEEINLAGFDIMVCGQCGIIFKAL